MMQPIRRLKIGLIVNPYAGIGGPAGLKGSDGEVIRHQALTYNSNLRSPKRLMQCLDALAALKESIDWTTALGNMGSNYLEEWPYVNVIYKASAHPTALDTQVLAQKLLKEQVDIIMFVGGDGTARDVQLKISTKIPCFGLPSGVKMQSGVFAISPIAASEIIKGLIKSELISCSPQDVRDIDESALRNNRVLSTFYGSMLVPDEPKYVQSVKQGGVEVESMVLDDIADEIEVLMDEGSVLLIGPGSTTAHFMSRLKLPNTLVGFDAIKTGQLIASDLNELSILDCFRDYPQAKVVLSPTGNQGILLGRGNQQISPKVIRLLNKRQIIIISTKNKLKALDGKPLLVDTGDAALDASLCGLYPIITGIDDAVLYPINTAYS